MIITFIVIIVIFQMSMNVLIRMVVVSINVLTWEVHIRVNVHLVSTYNLTGKVVELVDHVSPQAYKFGTCMYVVFCTGSH